MAPELHHSPIGVWTFNLELAPWAHAAVTAREIEALGFSHLWFPEAVGREAMSQAALLLSATERLVVATGIASIYARDAVTAGQAHRTLTEAFPERFLFGLGVSHANLVSGLRGHDYSKPYSRMVEYLDGMDATLYLAAEPTAPLRRVLAALGPRMLALAGERAMGAHPYFTTPEHTAEARRILGSGPFLAPEQAVVFSTDPAEARRIARTHTALYCGLPNYRNNLARFGWTDDADFEHAGSDRLVDAIVAWGDLDAIVARIQQHLDAGADHVAVQVITEDPARPPLEEWRQLAAAFGLG